MIEIADERGRAVSEKYYKGGSTIRLKCVDRQVSALRDHWRTAIGFSQIEKLQILQIEDENNDEMIEHCNLVVKLVFFSSSK